MAKYYSHLKIGHSNGYVCLSLYHTMFQNVLECSHIFKNDLKCSLMFRNVLDIVEDCGGCLNLLGIV